MSVITEHSSLYRCCSRTVYKMKTRHENMPGLKAEVGEEVLIPCDRNCLIWDSVTSVEKLHLSVHPKLLCQICAISLFQLQLRDNNNENRLLPSGISVEDECEMLYSEAGCKSGYPDCLPSLIMKSKKRNSAFVRTWK